MPEVSIKITPRMEELYKNGVITITAEVFSSGIEVYGRVVRPHPRIGVYPHQSQSLEELEASLEKVVIKDFEGTPSVIVKDKAPFKPKKGTAVRVATRNESGIGPVPCALTVGGITNSLPKSSLTWRDLENLSDDQLNRRIQSIGKEIGADKAVSHITTNSELNHLRAETLHEWWVKADIDQRWTLITRNKLVGKPTTHTTPLLERLGRGQYPFRGTDRPLPFETSEDEEEEFGKELAEEFEEGLRLDFDNE